MSFHVLNKDYSYTQVSSAFLIQEDFDIFRVLLFGVFFCVADNFYRLFFTYEKKKKKKTHLKKIKKKKRTFLI